MTLRDEFVLWRFFKTTDARAKIAVSPRLYRAMRHHPHFRFFMSRVRKLNNSREFKFTLPSNTYVPHFWMDEAMHLPPDFLKESVRQTPKESV